ncbi:UNVERIFIED_CONTAM: hypothetical protein FKN15_042957 [Acipenser sinensis]
MTMAEEYKKLRDWILENAGLEAKSMPVAIQILWMMDRERWEAYAREHTLSTWEEGVELVLSYLEAAINKTAAQPKRGESVRPQPKREESVRPQPKREESVRPQPKEGGVGASIAQEGEGGACTALGPKLPAEGECLLVPPPPAEEKCLLSPCPPAEGKCLLVSLPPPAEGECLLGPRPPAEDECLLVTLPQPAEDECLLVTLPQPAEDECLLVTLPQPAEDECLLVTLPQPAEDECLLVTLPQPAEDECLLVTLPQPAEVLWPEPHHVELPATKKGEVGGPPAPAAFPLPGLTQLKESVGSYADSVVSSSLATGSIAARGPTEASLPSPRLCPGLLGF